MGVCGDMDAHGGQHVVEENRLLGRRLNECIRGCFHGVVREAMVLSRAQWQQQICMLVLSVYGDAHIEGIHVWDVRGQRVLPCLSCILSIIDFLHL
jgi:hypothetical protein